MLLKTKPTKFPRNWESFFNCQPPRLFNLENNQETFQLFRSKYLNPVSDWGQNTLKMQKMQQHSLFFHPEGISLIHSIRNRYKTELLVVADRSEREADDVNRAERKLSCWPEYQTSFWPLNSLPKFFEVVKSIFCIISQIH